MEIIIPLNVHERSFIYRVAMLALHGLRFFLGLNPFMADRFLSSGVFGPVVKARPFKVYKSHNPTMATYIDISQYEHIAE